MDRCQSEKLTYDLKRRKSRNKKAVDKIRNKYKNKIERPREDPIWKSSNRSLFRKMRHHSVKSFRQRPDYSEMDRDSYAFLPDSERRLETFGVSYTRRSREKSGSPYSMSDECLTLDRHPYKYLDDRNVSPHIFRSHNQLPKYDENENEKLAHKRNVEIVTFNHSDEETSPCKIEMENNENEGIEITGDYEVLSEISEEEEGEITDNPPLSDNHDAIMYEYDRTQENAETIDHTITYRNESTKNEESKYDLCRSESEQYRNINVIQHCQPNLGETEPRPSRLLTNLPCIFNPSKNTQEQNDQIVRKIVPLLVHGKMTLDALIREISRNCDLKIVIEDPKEFKNFLEKYDRCFIVEQEKGNSSDTVLVSSITDIEFCKEFTAPKNSKMCSGRCGALHICKYHILGKCEAGMHSCPYGHYIYTPHNKPVLFSHFLNGLQFKEIQSFLKLPLNRRSAAIPKICSHYNVERGCRDDKSCKFLHICSYMFHDEGCKFWPKCKRSHDVNDTHNQHILEIYGLDKIDEIETLTMIKKASDESKKFDKKQTVRKEVQNRSLTTRIFQGSLPANSTSKTINEEEYSLSIPHCNDADNKDNTSNITWSCVHKSSNVSLPLNQMEMKEFEKHYQKYKSYEFCTISINGERFSVDMKSLSASKEDSNDDGQFIFNRKTISCPDFIPLEI